MRYTYDGWRLAEWGAPDGTVLADYAYGNGLDELLHARWYGFNVDYYYLQDDQGSVIALADASGSVVERYGYGPGGDPIAYNAQGQPQPGGFSSPQLFAGREYDLETGLYYSRLRYYAPHAGRFITRDPLGACADPTAWGNPYAHCGNSPWDMVDPLGLDPAVPDSTWGRRWYVLKEFGAGLGTTPAYVWNFVFSSGVEEVKGINPLQDVQPLAPVNKELYNVADPFALAERKYKGNISEAVGQWIATRNQVVSGTGEALKNTAIDCGTAKAVDALGAAVGSIGRLGKKAARGELRKAMGLPPANMINPEAHHKLPWEFREFFNSKGMDINDPKYGTWVEREAHRKFSHDYNKLWSEFIAKDKIEPLTQDDIINFMNYMNQNEP